MQKSVRRALLCLLAGAGLTVHTVAAETYKWTDAEGKVHYSDQPPPASVKNPTTLTPRKKTSRSAPQADANADAAKVPETKPAVSARPRTTQELDAEFRQRRVKEAEDEAARKKAELEAADKKRNCAQATNNVKRLEQGGRLTRYNEQGEAEFLEDSEIAAELARARQAADSWCR